MKTSALLYLTLMAVTACTAALAANNSLDGLKFSHPRNITHPYLPLAALKQDILEGKEDGKNIRIERTTKPELKKTFTINGQTIESFAVEDREFKDGELEEVALDYFAQADDGTVLYLGEDVDEYKRGKVVGHSGSWLFGKDTQHPGVMLPGRPKVGVTFKSEDVNDEIHEDDEIVSDNETVPVPAGNFRNCIKVKETLAEGDIEYKYFAFGVGCVREVPKDGNVVLKSHLTRSKAEMRAEANALAGASATGKKKGKVVEDPLAREALALVGVNAEAEKYWFDAVHDTSLPKSERQDLIDDLNEKGLPDPKHPTPEDLSIIKARLNALDAIAPTLSSEIDYKEARRDLLQLIRVANGSPEKIN